MRPINAMPVGNDCVGLSDRTSARACAVGELDLDQPVRLDLGHHQLQLEHRRDHGDLHQQRGEQLRRGQAARC